MDFACSAGPVAVSAWRGTTLVDVTLLGLPAFEVVDDAPRVGLLVE
jgi:hypothetical protein